MKQRDGNDADDARKVKESIATQLVELASEAECYRSVESETFATINVSGHQETWPLNSDPFRNWLSHRFYSEKGLVASSAALSDALNVLNGRALFGGTQVKIHSRVAEHAGAIYLDLCDTEWRAVKIIPSGWQVVKDPPVRFRRTKGMLPLPTPERGGSLDELDEFVNVHADDLPLVKAWLLAALRPKGPYPVLIFHGEQGSAKSTSARVLCDLLDPNEAALRSDTKSERDLMISATNRLVVAFDNLSHISAPLSDALCRLATGGGYATRANYTDAEEKIFNVQRPVLLTGIDELATRSDLLDRALLVSLPTIPEGKRRPESVFWAKFRQAQPRIIGALLDAVSEAMAREGSVKLPKLPRMADFALWATASEPALGLEDGQFLVTYERNRDSANEVALEADPIAAALISFMSSQEQWKGTAGELLKLLNEKKDQSLPWNYKWPRTATNLSTTLTRLTPNLRKRGIEVERDRTSKTRFIEIRRSPASPAS